MLSSHPSYKEQSRAVRQITHEKMTDVQFKVDKQPPLFCPLDGFYHLYILFPADTISPLLDCARLEELLNQTSPV